jgi:hypothetical protein
LTASGVSPRTFWSDTSVLALGISSGVSSTPHLCGFCLEDYGREFVLSRQVDGVGDLGESLVMIIDVDDFDCVGIDINEKRAIFFIDSKTENPKMFRFQ